MFRTRQLIPHVKLPDSFMDDCYEDSWTEVAHPPPLIAKSNPSAFGMFVDKLIHAMIHTSLKEKIVYFEEGSQVDDWKTVSYSIYTDTIGNISVDEFNKYIPWMQNIHRFVLTELQDFETIELEPEYIHQSGLFMGHPDLVCDDVVIDIKTTRKFSNMAEETLKQLLAYTALLQDCGKKITMIGVLLPLQKKLHIWDVYNDNTTYLNSILSVAKKALGLEKNPLDTHLLGSHTAKIQGSIHRSLLSYYRRAPIDRPAQIFFRNCRNGRGKLTQSDINATYNYVQNNNLRLYVHGAYCANLCDPVGNKDKADNEDEPFGIKIVREDLQWAAMAGAKGVVVHMGSCAKRMSKGVGIDNFIEYVSTLLNFTVDDEVYLILETSCAEGEELGGTFEEFRDIYMTFTEAERKSKLAICVDTAHVWAAGYEPIKYLERWEAETGNIPLLVHFNDSRVKKGSKRDAHAPYGRGYIGKERLDKVIEYCTQRNIDMIIE